MEKINKMKMVYVQGGTFQMGSEPNYDGRPGHSVTVSSFNIGKYEVTQAQWVEIMGENPSFFKGDKLPVESVSWIDVQGFIEKLNARTGKTYRLPTEAEWEYAARGGSKSKGFEYSGSNSDSDVAWHNWTSDGDTHPVGRMKPNELGLYDMSGNVYEWCSDWYGSYHTEAQVNPKGAEKGDYRVHRGGAWFFGPLDCRVAYRQGSTPTDARNYLGFRLVL